MKKKEYDAILYDWHNDIKLQNQNKDIVFYQSLLKGVEWKKILIVGAGTGRVALPLSKKQLIVALDINKDRLNRIKKKNNSRNNIEMICKDISKFESNNKFNFIIFPYSTMQNIHPNSKRKRTLRKIKSLLSEDGICIIDNSEKFSEFKNCNYKTICEGFCKELNEYIVEKEKVRMHKKYVKLIKKYENNNHKKVVKQTEKWFFLQDKEFEKYVEKEGLTIVNKINGYDETTKHRLIYILGKENNK